MKVYLYSFIWFIKCKRPFSLILFLHWSSLFVAVNCYQTWITIWFFSPSGLTIHELPFDSLVSKIIFLFNGNCFRIIIFITQVWSFVLIIFKVESLPLWFACCHVHQEHNLYPFVWFNFNCWIATPHILRSNNRYDVSCIITCTYVF